ncbi:MAG: transporter substrate-binding domain-containing protein [Chthoniobacterales bacterium]
MITRWILFLLLSTALLRAEPAPLRVGMDLSYPPFETIGPEGRPAGISVDLAEALGNALGRPVQIENMPFTGLIPALQSGKIDLIISSMTATPERARAVAFSEPYLTTGLGALVPAASTAPDLASIDQPGRTVVVRQGTTGEVFARANVRQAAILNLEKENACVLEVAQGKADAFIYDQMSVFQNGKRHPGKVRALLAPLQKESWAIALRPAETELLAGVNAFLTRFRAEGGFTQLADRYLAEEKAAFAAQGIPFVF